jgi:S-adenosylmethionine hydrolase
MPVPLITLTTDFGLSDHYVGAMKGVILSICPPARIVDISHGVSAYEIAEGAFTVAQAYRYFPRGTVHVVVVDPGVGTTRRPILVQAASQYFVAPDNGVLSMIYAREKHKARAITNERYFLQPVSQTFHGRDIFAPVAAHLAKGVAPARFGKLILDHLRQDYDKPARTGRRQWTGAVLKVDRFGNMVTNFSVSDFPDLGQREFEMAAGPRRIHAIARHYAEHGPGEPFLIVGSAGYYEISVSQGSAAKLLGCAAGAPLELTLL